MDNQKQKKIQKRKKKNPKAQKSFRRYQQVPQNLQQFEQSEGIFTQMLDQNISKQNNSQLEGAPQSVKVEKNCVGYEFINGQFFILKIGSSYKLANSLNRNVDVSIIDGLVNINGKLFANLFLVKQQSSIILTAAINQQVNKKQNQIEKNNRQVGKSKQKNKNNKVQSQKSSLNKNLEQISRKIQQKMKVSSLNQQFYDYLADYESSQNILIWVQKKQIQVFNLQNTPWKNIDLLKYIRKGQTTMLIGQKNTGKSIFCEFLLNEAQRRKQQLCVLDIDIGRNRIFPGCVSFTYADSAQNRKDYSIWIGEYTPLNNLSVYFKAISQFFNMYKEKYFTSSLILNTMGYLTGVGELIIYEVFNILKPQNVLVMQSVSNQQQWSVKNVTNCIRTGKYIERLYFQQGRNNSKTSTKIQTYVNLHSQKKPAAQRFQSQIARNPIRSLEELIELILMRKLISLGNKFAVYQFTKNGHLRLHEQYNSNLVNLRLLILGDFYKDQLISVKGFGFGWNGQIYYDPVLFKEQPKIVLLSEGVDFEKSFYNINQFKMIQLQNKLGMKIPFMLPMFKTLGNKGMRNNSSRKSNINKA